MLNNIKESEIYNNLECLDLNRNKDESKNKNYRLIIVKKINFIIKKVPKKENALNNIN